MAVISRFCKDQSYGSGWNREQEAENIKMFRKIADSEDIRIVLGNFFLSLAATDATKSPTPHKDLLNRMLNGSEPPGTDQLRILVDNLDRLRLYDSHKK